RRYLGEAAEASKLYQSIIDGNRRLEHPSVRLAAVRWGDLFAEAGELARAGEAYRAARELGGEKFKNTAQTEAVTRGALLRFAETRLKRAQAGPEGLLFAGFRTGFEPGDKTPPQQLQAMRVVAGQGIAGSHVCCLESLPVTKAASGVLQYELKNITPSGHYWV